MSYLSSNNTNFLDKETDDIVARRVTDLAHSFEFRIGYD